MTKTNQCSILHFQLILGRKIRIWELALNFFMSGTNEVFIIWNGPTSAPLTVYFRSFQAIFKQNKLWTSLASELDHQSRR